METGGVGASPVRNADGRADGALGAIVLDASSGISLEEQREILAGIDAMSAGNRLVPETAEIKAAKRDDLFPLFVNIGAAVLLGLGLLLLSLFHGRDEQDVRESSASLGLTERKLIQEIRQETSRRIDEKENEINGVLSRLSEAEAEYRQLRLSVESVAGERKERADSLLAEQEEFRSLLAGLREEKARIIEESRQGEASLRERSGEQPGEERGLALSSRLAAGQEDPAAEELGRLTDERERAARAGNHIAGSYAEAREHIDEGRLDEASRVLASMRDFLDAPSLRGIPSLEEEKPIHLAAIAAMEAAVDEARRSREDASASGGAARAEAAEALARQIEELKQEREQADEANAAEMENRRQELARLEAGIKSLNDQIATERNEASQRQIELQATISQQASDLDSRDETLRSIPGVVEQAMESPSVQGELGPDARQRLAQFIQDAIRTAVGE